MAKLCALVCMQRMAGPTVQSFSLPMTLVDKEMQQVIHTCLTEKYHESSTNTYTGFVALFYACVIEGSELS